MAPTVTERAQAVFGRVLAQTYGQAEAPMAITVLQPDEHDRVGAAGRPYTLVDVRVVDEEDREVPVGQTGEIVTRGQHVMSGYWNRPDATADAFTDDGWFRSGDQVTQDAAGYIQVVDRIKDVINTGGVLVAPREVEDAIYELDEGSVPLEVVIDEAVTLAKRYATEEAGRLVNGILGRIAREKEVA